MIAAIIIGSLIVLSVLWCVFSCLCCGISLCAACGRCVTCFGCCGACDRGSRRRKDPEYQPMPPTPTPYQGYQPQNNMMYNGNGPQFATFDAGNKRSANIHEDSLPTMPSWDTAQTRRVEDRSPQPRGADMEMERMLPQHTPASPIRDSPYQSAPYQSDLGAQRLGQHHQQQQQQEYYDPPNQPLSPAPTYYSTAPPMAGALHAPQQHEYHDTSYNSNTNYSAQTTGYTPNATPYPSSRESTQFAQSRAMSPPQHEQQNYSSYQTPAPNYEQAQASHYELPQDNRPPSMLQPGRRPVAGSYREV